MNIRSRKFKILSWNVRGLNEKDKRATVLNFINSEKSDIVCLQETKLASIDDAVLKQIVGTDLRRKHA
jgi:exonuclease III